MPRIKEIKTNWVSGELDPDLKSRSDVKAYYNGADLMRNVECKPQGGFRVRAGKRFIAKVPLLAGGGLSQCRGVEFMFSTEQIYYLVFSHLRCDVYRLGVLVATVVMPYTSDDIKPQYSVNGNLISSGLSFTQTRNTILIFHQGHAIRELVRGSTHSSWTLNTYAVRNLPQVNFGDVVYTNGVDEVQEITLPNPGSEGDWVSGDIFQLILENEKTDNIRYSPTGETMRARIQAAIRRLPNVDPAGITVTSSNATTSASVFAVTFSGGNGDRPWGSMAYDVVSSKQVPSVEVFVITPGVRGGEVCWSAARGYPRCGCFYGGRLWVAGTPFLPNTAWASRAGTPTDFNSKKIDSDYGIMATTDTDDVPAFLNIFAGRHLQFFATSAEFYIPISETEPVTPANIVFRRTTSRGSKAGLRVFDVDGATHFVQRGGQALREFIFAETELAYQANSISLLSSHLIRDPVSFALRRSVSTDDADLEFMPNSDGTQTVFCTLRTQEVNGMTLWTTKGSYRDVTVLLDEVYFLVDRTIDGITETYIERMDYANAFDCAMSFDVEDPEEPLTTITLAHLPNTLVEYIVDGFIREEKMTDEDGILTLDRPATQSVVAGLRFPKVYGDYIWTAKTLPFERELQDGASMGRKRRVVSVDVRVSEMTDLEINGNRLAFRQFGQNALDTPVVPFTGIKRIRGLAGWDFDGQVTLGSKVSKPGGILGLSYTVSI